MGGGDADDVVREVFRIDAGDRIGVDGVGFTRVFAQIWSGVSALRLGNDLRSYNEGDFGDYRL